MPTPLRLTEPELLAATLAVLDERGLAGLSMRALAERLGVQAASLYGHVESKRDLLTRVADAICAAAVQTGPTESWSSTLGALGGRLRDQLRIHPGAAAVIASQPISSAMAERFKPLIDQLAIDMRSTVSDAAFAAQTVYLFTAGHALAEHGDPPAEPSRPRSYYDAWFEFGLRALIRGMAPRNRAGDTPQIARTTPNATRHDPRQGGPPC